MWIKHQNRMINIDQAFRIQIGYADADGQKDTVLIFEPNEDAPTVLPFEEKGFNAHQALAAIADAVQKKEHIIDFDAPRP